MKTFVLTLLLTSIFSCSHSEKRGKAFVSHAENFNILFFQIPGHDTYEVAMKGVPQGAKITNIDTMPSDTETVAGIVNRILGVDFVQITGTVD